MTSNELSIDAMRLSDLANLNLELLTGKCQEKNETQDYYLGILRKQAVLLSDLSLILNNRNSEYISTPFIILRSLLDDFLHLIYLETHIDRETEITRINANSYRHCFHSLNTLTNSNYQYFDGKYPFYLTHEQLQLVKDKFIAEEKNKRYFLNLEKFKFKEFMRFDEMVKCISISKTVDIFIDRAYYLWKEFSSFVHYSNYSFDYEIRNAPENLYMIDESFQYSYNSIFLAFKHFERKLNLKFKDNDELRIKHGIIYNC